MPSRSAKRASRHAAKRKRSLSPPPPPPEPEDHDVGPRCRKPPKLFEAGSCTELSRALRQKEQAAKIAKVAASWREQRSASADGPAPPPPPPPDWRWPLEGEAIEVEVAPERQSRTATASWCAATVQTVHLDSWFSAEIIHGDDRWTEYGPTVELATFCHPQSQSRWL